MSNSVAERIARLVEPIKSDIAALDVEIAAVTERLEGLKADRRQLNAVLRATQPSNGSKPGPKPKKPTITPPSEETIEAVRAFIRQLDPEGRERIIGAHLAREIEAAATDDDYPRKDAVRRALHTLHERGELRLRRTRTPGGGAIYSYLGG